MSDGLAEGEEESDDFHHTNVVANSSQDNLLRHITAKEAETLLVGYISS